MDSYIKNTGNYKTIIDGNVVDQAKWDLVYDGNELNLEAKQNGDLLYMNLTNDDIINLLQVPASNHTMDKRILQDKLHHIPIEPIIIKSKSYPSSNTIKDHSLINADLIASKSRSRPKSKSRPKSRSRPKSKSTDLIASKSRSRPKSKSRPKSRSRPKSKSRPKSRPKSRSRTTSITTSTTTSTSSDNINSRSNQKEELVPDYLRTIY